MCNNTELLGGFGAAIAGNGHCTRERDFTLLLRFCFLFLLLPHKKIKRLTQERASENFGYIWIASKGSTGTLKATQFFSLDSMHFDHKTSSMSERTWLKDWKKSIAYLLHFYLLSHELDREGFFSRDTGREVQCYPYGEIKLLFVYSYSYL